MGKRHQDDVRAKLSATQLSKILLDHATGKKLVDKSQIDAASILLRKVLPDLSAIEYTQQEELPEENQLLDRIFSILTAHPDLARSMVGRLQQALGQPLAPVAAPLPAAEQPVDGQEAA